MELEPFAHRGRPCPPRKASLPAPPQAAAPSGASACSSLSERNCVANSVMPSALIMPVTCDAGAEGVR